MKLSVLGLGYVGCVSAACFAKRGHDVVGADINQVKVDIINAGKSPIIEPGIEDFISETVSTGKLRATTDAVQAVLDTDISLVCVGTPGQHNGSLDLTYIQRVCEDIGAALAQRSDYHVVAMRSTMLPGTIHGTVIPTLENISGKKSVQDFGVIINPEFLREGTSIYDFNNPPFTLIGADDEKAARSLKELYSFLSASLHIIRVQEAEMVKYACNSFHAVKVVFANEIGNICKKLGIDSHPVMDVFCKDTKLNLSPYYLKPGFAYGGSCLPKDVRAIAYKAKSIDIDAPLINSLNQSNRIQIEIAVNRVLQTGKRNVGILGMSFKKDTDDLRESPMVSLIETLIGKGIKLSIYDRDVELARLFGANKGYIEKEIPHISSLMCNSLSEVVTRSEVIVVGKTEAEYAKILQGVAGKIKIIDLVRLPDIANLVGYDGLCW